jgi:MFS family permease
VNVALLRQRNFGLLWFAGLVSIVGDWALRVALPIYVLRLTGSSAAVAGVVVAELAGTLVCGPFAGAYVDRWDRRRVVTLVNALQAVLLAPLLAVDRADRLWIVIAVAFAESVLAQFFVPAQSALLPRLVPADQLGAANALAGLNRDVGRLVGPAVGGVVAATIGLRGAAVVDAGSFLAAFALCALITGVHRAGHAGERRRLGAEMLDGLRFLAGHRLVRGIAIAMTVTAIGEGMLGTLFAVFVTRGLHAGAGAFGSLMSAQAIGGIVGGLAAGRIIHRYRPIPLSVVALVCFGTIDLVIFNYPRFATTLWPIQALFVLVGLPAAIGMAALFTLLQGSVPDRLRGRVIGAVLVLDAVAGILGAVLAGALGDRFAVTTLLTVQGSGYLLAALLLRLLVGPGPDSLAAAIAVDAGSPIEPERVTA